MISPFEVMRGNILLFEGKNFIVKGVNDYVLLDGRKEWIGGSMMSGEPISSVWLQRLGFSEFLTDDCRRQLQALNWEIRVAKTSIGDWIIYQGFGGQWTELRRADFVHQVQNLYYSLTGEFCHLPKSKK